MRAVVLLWESINKSCLDEKKDRRKMESKMKRKQCYSAFLSCFDEKVEVLETFVAMLDVFDTKFEMLIAFLFLTYRSRAVCSFDVCVID